MKRIFGEHCFVTELPTSPIRSAKGFYSAFRGHIDGVRESTIKPLLETIREHEIEQVFVDGSNLGEMVRSIKKRYPNIRVCTFFHNVEARFFLGALKQTKSPRALAVLMVNYLAEKKSVRFSDKIVCLNQRDSDLLKRVYGRGATHLSPMALEDKATKKEMGNTPEPEEKFALFVGGTFYANRQGIRWFKEHVAPHVSIKTVVVGRGFEDIRNKIELEGRIRVVGAVDDLAEWYEKAHFVIAPIFDGSGMKTKVAEALMFGKKIIGTKEAFTGYEGIVDKAGRLCQSADDFIRAFDEIDEIVTERFDTSLRTIYEEQYSMQAAQKRMQAILAS
jgi:glycosyltransferase involved in cell wall biosynthesis